MSDIATVLSLIALYAAVMIPFHMLRARSKKN